MSNEDKKRIMEYNVISINKLIANIKSFWWLCLLCVLAGVFITVSSTLKEYKNNVALASRDMYVSGADFYFDSDVDKDSSIWSVMMSSQSVREKTKENMRQLYQDELRDTDVYYIQEKGGRFCYGITVIGEGEAHTLALARSVAAAFEETVLECTSDVMSPIDLPSKADPCVVLQSGAILTFRDPSDRSVSLSMGDFLSWKKMMIIMACAFAGLGVIFVMILFDNKIRGKEEMEVICDKACIADLRKKGEKATAPIKIDHVKQEGAEYPIVMATLTDAVGFEKAELILGNRMDGVVRAQAICRDAAGLLECSNQKKVILVVKQDKDTVGLLREAIKNLELVNAGLIGYILV